MLDAYDKQHDLEMQARDLLASGCDLQTMIRDAASAMRNHAQNGNMNRAAEYSDDIHTLQRVHHESIWADRPQAATQFSDCNTRRILTLHAWASRLMHAPYIGRDCPDHNPLRFRDTELMANPLFERVS